MFRTIRIIKLIFLYFPKKKRGEKKINKNEIFSQESVSKNSNSSKFRKKSSRGQIARGNFPRSILDRFKWIEESVEPRPLSGTLRFRRILEAVGAKRKASRLGTEILRSSVRKPRAFRGNPICVCSSVSRFRIRVS